MATKRDAGKADLQNQLGAALSSVGKTISRLLDPRPISQEDRISLVEWLSDGGRLLADGQYGESVSRKALLVNMGFKKKLKDNFKDVLMGSQVDQFLFGSNLAEVVEQTKTLYQNSQKIIENRQFLSAGNKQRPLNFKSPSYQYTRKGDGQKKENRRPRQTMRPRDNPASDKHRFYKKREEKRK